MRSWSGRGKRNASYNCKVAVWAVGVSFTVACASGASQASARSVQGSARILPNTASHVQVAGDELNAIGYATLYDALQQVRPEYLRSRFPSGTEPEGSYAEVYLNRQYLGDLSTLRTILTRSVLEVRYVSPVAGYHLLGHLHRGGVILVTAR